MPLQRGRDFGVVYVAVGDLGEVFLSSKQQMKLVAPFSSLFVHTLFVLVLFSTS